jgi:hypothetical protein
MYLQWTNIDVGYPDYREANRILYIYWEACKADKRSFGMIYLKIRRSGFSFMSSSECVNTGTLARTLVWVYYQRQVPMPRRCLPIRLFL